MALRGPRFSGDPVLEDCLLGRHRMFAPEEGIAVLRVQAALIELGRSVGPRGADGIFGSGTGGAVSAYKVDKGLAPSDPVVGAGTMKALDDDLFFQPPDLEPVFAEFGSMVVSRRVDPLIGQELAGLIGAPFDSWRRMLGKFALANLTSGELLGVVVQSRREDMRARYSAIAAPVQRGGVTASKWFDDQSKPGPDPKKGSAANTVVFSLPDGSAKTFVWVKDNVILGREVIERTSTGQKAPVTLLGVLLHELTHVRNHVIEDSLRAVPDTDSATYVDTALAQARSATGTPTSSVLRSFVAEMCGRHVHWIALQEAAGTPVLLSGLTPAALAAAVHQYFTEFTPIYDSNGYGAQIKAQGNAAVFRQLDLWLRRCRTFSFSDNAAENARTRALFGAAAAICASLAAEPGAALPAADGLFPLAKDLH